MKDYCECPYNSVATPLDELVLDPINEMPYRIHKPHECKCTNDLREVDGVTLCSMCRLSPEEG